MPRDKEYKDRASDVLKGVAAKFFNEESNRKSLITVTNVIVSSDGSHATILLSVLPQNQESAVMDFAKRKVRDFRMFVRKNSRMGRVPFIEFALDTGEQNRQRIDELSNEADL